MIARAIAVWLALVLLAIANGLFREAVLAPRLEAQAAHYASTFLLCAIIVALTLGTISWIRPPGAAAALAVGVLWCALVVAFEFGFGHFVAGDSWADLFAQYDVFQGRAWVAVPVLTLVMPYAAARLRGVVP